MHSVMVVCRHTCLTAWPETATMFVLRTYSTPTKLPEQQIITFRRLPLKTASSRERDSLQMAVTSFRILY